MNNLRNKKIIIVGPALNQPSDKFLKKFDYVIRTNNFINSSLSKKRCDILLLNNITCRVMDRKTLLKIKKSKIKFIVCYRNHIKKLSKFLKNKKFIGIRREKKVKVGKHIINFKHAPTIIYIFIMNLLNKKIKFNNLFIDGIDFYMKKRKYIRGYSWAIHKMKQNNSHNMYIDRKFLLFLLRSIKRINSTNYIKKLTKI
jgi:hypothetical protein